MFFAEKIVGKYRTKNEYFLNIVLKKFSGCAIVYTDDINAEMLPKAAFSVCNQEV